MSRRKQGRSGSSGSGQRPPASPPKPSEQAPSQEDADALAAALASQPDVGDPEDADPEGDPEADDETTITMSGASPLDQVPEALRQMTEEAESLQDPQGDEESPDDHAAPDDADRAAQATAQAYAEHVAGDCAPPVGATVETVAEAFGVTPDVVTQLLGLMGSTVPLEAIERPARELIEATRDAAELRPGDIVTYRAPAQKVHPAMVITVHPDEVLDLVYFHAPTYMAQKAVCSSFAGRVPRAQSESQTSCWDAR